MSEQAPAAGSAAPASGRDALRRWLRVEISWGGTDVRTWTRHLTRVVVAAVVGLTFVIADLPAALDDSFWSWSSLGATLGFVLVLYALARAVVGAFGPLPRGLERSSNRWRIGWSLAAVTLATVVLTNVTFAVNDHVHSEENFCDDGTDGGAVATTSTTAPVTVAETAAEPTTTTSAVPEPTQVPPSAPAGVDTTPSTSIDTPDASAPAASAEEAGAEDVVAEEAFGFERGIQSSSFLVTVTGEGDVGALTTSDFDVYSDDGRAGQSFARVASVVPLSDRDATVRVEVDLACHDGLEGGEFAVTTVYNGDIPLDRQSWDLRVTLQSRLLFYFLAVVPWITIAAMYQVFAMWPPTFKRWFTSLIAIVVPVLTAYRVTGLNNPTWQPDLLTLGALIGASYAAAITAANLIKNGGHNIDDGTR